MRFIRPSEGERRTSTWFAFLPVTIGKETRWLEKVAVRQQWKDGFIFEEKRWENLNFINDHPTVHLMDKGNDL